MCESVPTKVSGKTHPSRDDNDSPQMLEVDLMADPHARRHDAKALECLLSPVEQRVAFAVATVLPLQIRGIGIGAAKAIDLHRVIDDQIDRDEGIDSLRIAARSGDRASQGREVDDCRNAGEVLHQHSCRHECDGRIGAVRPPGKGDDIRFGHVPAAGPAGDVLQQDLDGVRQPRHIRAGLRRQLRAGSRRRPFPTSWSASPWRRGDRLSWLAAL